MNLLVIEAKKFSFLLPNSHVEKCACDLCKLKFYKKELGYQYAYFIKFPVKDDYKKAEFQATTMYVEEIE